MVVLAVATAETENLIGAAELRPDEAGRVSDQRVARQPGRRSGARGGAGRGPDRRLRHGRRPRARPDAVARDWRACHNVVATPHIGGLVPPAIEHQALETARQVAEIVRGDAPPGAVNPEQATRLARLRRS